MKKVRTKLCLLPQISGVEVAPCLLAKSSGVEVTPSVTSVESCEQFWRKIRQIWRICEPCLFLNDCNILGETTYCLSYWPQAEAKSRAETRAIQKTELCPFRICIHSKEMVLLFH